jgi:hypothetical protein
MGFESYLRRGMRKELKRSLVFVTQLGKNLPSQKVR